MKIIPVEVVDAQAKTRDNIDPSHKRNFSLHPMKCHNCFTWAYTLYFLHGWWLCRGCYVASSERKSI